MFQEQYFLQLRGAAMRSPVAPNDANLFMGKFLLDFIYNNNPYSNFVRKAIKGTWRTYFSFGVKV